MKINNIGDKMEYLKSADLKVVDNVLSGYLVRFTSAKDTDLDGEYFDKSTEFGFDKTTERPVFFHHGNNKHVKKVQIGNGKLTKTDDGIFIEAVLKERSGYEQAILQLGKKSKLGWSSGAVPNLIERSGNYIKQWIIGEASVTHTPAEYRNITKSYEANKLQKAINYILKHDLTDVQKEQLKSLFPETETKTKNNDDVIMKYNELLTTIEGFKWI
jgi:hypothetical protein